MNKARINSLLSNIDYYVDHDTYFFNRSMQNQLHVKIDELRAAINNTYAGNSLTSSIS